MTEHKCVMCDTLISLFRVFCSKDCEIRFFKKYPEEE